MSKGAQRFTVRATKFLALMAIGLVAGAVRSDAQQAAPRGEAVYVQYCQGCHSETGEGNPGVYPPLAGSEWVTGSPSRLLNILIHGLTGPVSVAGEVYTGLMPGWGVALKSEEIAAVATYLRTTWGNFAPAVTVADVDAVREASKTRTAPWTVADLVAATSTEK